MQRLEKTRLLLVVSSTSVDILVTIHGRSTTAAGLVASLVLLAPSNKDGFTFLFNDAYVDNHA
jgi:hypothetical protein